MTDINKIREQFEVYWKSQLWAECYADVKEQMFTIWMASREAVVVELPELRSVPDRDCWARTNGLGFNNALKETRQVIEALGLKVAP